MASHQFLDEATEFCAERGWGEPSFVASGNFKSTFRVDAAGELVALKLVDPHKISAERTEREIRALESCSHQHICRLAETGVHRFGGREMHFLVEEYLGGGTLTGRSRQYVGNDSKLRKLLGGLTSALTHLEPLNLVHRDIKPDNVMFRDEGDEPVLVDFGLVRVLGDTSLTGTWATQGPGTPLYSAPEQLHNDKHLIDGRADQFSMALVLGELYFGKHPFDAGGSTRSIVERMASRRLPADWFISAVNGHFLEPTLKMLKSWPVGRYRSPEAVRTAFEF
ncbi:MAG: serine/threonine-protein kinase [Myxococcota bacterium]